jgi:hypothetical protein
VPDEAQGFEVIVPQATVADLGTEFGIEVDNMGQSNVVVFEGEIEVRADGTETRGRQQQALFTGQALRLDKQQNVMRLTSVWSDRFSASRQLKESQHRPRLVLEIDDNVDRIWEYYEIVHGGMGEDARALVSRGQQHEWNGLTERGMPSYLVGGDYVRMFKDNQIVPNIELELTLAAESRLFILFDERVPIPAWLESGFRPTGDRIGLDMGPWEGRDGDQYVYGQGPGNSIDRVATVWESKEPVSGVVRLGATESIVLGTFMYGVVAQPASELPMPTEGI